MTTEETRLVAEAMAERAALNDRNKLEAFLGVVIEIGSGVNVGKVRVRRYGLEPTDAGRGYYYVLGDDPTVGQEVLCLANFATGVVEGNFGPADTHAFYAERTTNQDNIPSATNVKIIYDVATVDDPWYINDPTNGWVYKPLRAGYYDFSASVWIVPAVAGTRVELWLRKNGTIHSNLGLVHATNTTQIGANGAAFAVEANGTSDWFDCIIHHNFGVGTSDIDAVGCFFSGHMSGAS